jgi:hypothetical protein
LQNNVEHPSPHRIGDLIGEHARDPDPGHHRRLACSVPAAA